MNVASRSYVTAGVALIGASIIAVPPVTVPLSNALVFDVALIAGEEQITLDLVRHGETVGPTNVVSGPPGEAPIPGPPLDETGQEQAQAVAQAIQAEYDDSIAGIYAGQNIRMPETAAPLADQLGIDTQILPGLNEIPGGIYQGDLLSSPGGILYELTLAAWAFGLDFVPMPGSPDFNGVAFDESFSNAVQSIYDNTVSGGGPSTDVAFSGEAAITTWTLMNVNNPDASFFLPLFFNDLLSGKDILPNVGQVVLKGEPGDWTLVSFNGQPIPEDPGLLTDLIVDVRSLITAPQIATYNIVEALLGGDPTTIENAIQTGLSDVGSAIVQFPQSVVNDIIDALGDGTGAGETASDSLASLI
jgi:hypothetical protein